MIDQDHQVISSTDDSNSGSSDEENEDQSISDDAIQNGYYSFDCLTDGCIARYRYYGNLLRHYATGRHKMKLEKHSLIDKSKILFHQHLSTDNLRSTPLLSIDVIPPTTNSNIPPLGQNWASQKAKPVARFNEKQKQFLQEKFNEGIQTGSKW